MIDHRATGIRARAARLAAGETGLALRVVADKMQISVAYLSDLELGRRNWSEKLMEKLNTALESL